MSVISIEIPASAISSRNGIITEPDHHFTRFDLYEAMSVWDHEHVNAMLAWLQLPFWP